jgi:hypothetical protein
MTTLVNSPTITNDEAATLSKGASSLSAVSGPTQTIGEYAQAYWDSGLCFIPIRSDGSKAPVSKWKEFESRRPTVAELHDWFPRHRGLAIVCGAVSGNLECLDFDDASLFEPWRDDVRAIAPGLFERLTVHATPRPGWQVFYRCETIQGNTKLATRATDDPLYETDPTLIETRGEGGYVLAPGCAAECHKTRRRYVHADGPPITAVETITPDEREILFRVAGRFDRDTSKYCREFNAPDISSNGNGQWKVKPGDDYIARTSWHEILEPHGWKRLPSSGNVDYWQRPGKTGRGPSATTRFCGELMRNFSSNATPFEVKAYNRFAAYTLLNHAGDFKAAAKALSEAGYGTKAESAKNTAEGTSGGTYDAFNAYHALAVPWPDPLAQPAFHGLAGQLVRRIEPHSEADPAALLVQFLTAFGNIIGRGPHFVAESTRHYTNLFVILVGATAKGRKGSSWSNILHLTNAADDVWATTRVLSGLSSGEGLIWNVRDPIYKREPIKQNRIITGHQEVETDPGIADKRLLILEPEFANVFKVAGREGNTLSPIIRLAWDSGNLQSLAKNSPAKATGAHISIVGHITDDELRRNIDETEKANGFANRFQWFCVRRSKYLPEGGSFHKEPIQDLVKTLAKAVSFASAVGEMTRDDDARALWHHEYKRLSDGTPGMLGAILGRAEAQVMRVACLYALLDFSLTIRIEHLEAALAVWDYCERSARYIFGDAMGDKVADEVAALIRRNPEGITRQGIYEAFNKHLNKADTERALTTLQQANRIRFEKRETGGRPSEVWFPVQGQCVESVKSVVSPPPSAATSVNTHITQPEEVAYPL